MCSSFSLGGFRIFVQWLFVQLQAKKIIVSKNENYRHLLNNIHNFLHCLLLIFVLCCVMIGGRIVFPFSLGV